MARGVRTSLPCPLFPRTAYETAAKRLGLVLVGLHRDAIRYGAGGDVAGRSCTAMQVHLDLQPP
jgi:hypothetical protein